jgi:anti-sigma-K factor RskA
MSTDLHTLSGAYAIDAVSPEEAEQFRTHLAACAACRAEVHELREAASLMGASEAERPPAALRARVLAAADQTPQQPPKVTPIGSRSERAAGGARPGGRKAPWLAAVAAAAVVVTGAAIGLTQLNQDDEATLTAPVTQVFEAPDRHLAEVETAYGPVRVATSPTRNEMAVDARDLRDPGEGKVYQIWSIQGAQTSSVGLLQEDIAGASMAMPDPGTEVAITVEPAGGSEAPTSDPIVQVDPATV